MARGRIAILTACAVLATLVSIPAQAGAHLSDAASAAPQVQSAVAPRGVSTIPGPAGDGGQPLIDDSGVATVVYVDGMVLEESSASCSDGVGGIVVRSYDVRMVQSTDRKVWGAPRTLGSFTGCFPHSGGIRAAGNGAGDLVVVLSLPGGSGGYGLWIARVRAGSSVVEISSVPLAPSITVTDVGMGRHGIAILTLHDSSNGGRLLAMVGRPGQAWGTPVEIFSKYADYPRIVFDGNDVAHVMWLHYEGYDGTGQIHTIQEATLGSGASSWSAPNVLYRGDDLALNQVVSDGMGRLAIRASTGGALDLVSVLLVFDGSAWLPPRVATDANDRTAAIMAGGGGRFFATWFDAESNVFWGEVDLATGKVRNPLKGTGSLIGLFADAGGEFTLLTYSEGPYDSESYQMFSVYQQSDAGKVATLASGLRSPHVPFRTYPYSGVAMNSSGQGLLIGGYWWNGPGMPSHGWAVSFDLGGSSCSVVPSDGGPIDMSSVVSGRASGGGGDVSRKSLRFGAVEAVGCFEPLAGSGSRWAKAVSTAGMWVNSGDYTRIDGIDVPAPPGSLLFDTKAMRISWLPTTEIALAMQGAVFYRGKSGGSFKNPFSIQVSTGKTVKILSGKEALSVVGKPPARILGMDLAKDVGVRLEMGVDDRDGGYTQVSTTLGFEGSFNPDDVPVSRTVEQYAPCREAQRNSLVKFATKPNPMSTDFRYFRCELVDPLDPVHGFAWMSVKDALVSPGISFTVRTSNRSGLQLKQVRGVLGQVVAGPLMLENVELAFTPPTRIQRALWSLKGTGALRFAAGPLRNVKVTVGGTIADLATTTDPVEPSRWALQGWTVGVEARVPIGGPFSLTRLQMAVDAGDDLGGYSASGSVSLAGGIPVKIGPDEFDAFSVDGNFSYTSPRAANPDDTSSQPSPATFSVQGVGSLAGAQVGQFTVNAQLAGDFPAAISQLNVDGDITLSALKEKFKWIKRLGVSGSAKVVGAVNFLGKEAGTYQFQGAVRDLSIDRMKIGPFGGDVMFSERGIAMCAQSSTVSFISAGFSYLYSTGKVTKYLTGCDVAVVKSRA